MFRSFDNNDAYAYAVANTNKAYSVNGLNQYSAVAGAAYTYDASVKGSANTRFLTDGDALVAEYDGSGNLTNRYVHGSNAAADDPLVWYVGGGLSTRRYLHADHLGSIVAATNGASAPSILYDGDALVAEYDGTGALTNRYVHGSNAAADDPLVWYVGSGLATRRYLHADRLGSIVAV